MVNLRDIQQMILYEAIQIEKKHGDITHFGFWRTEEEARSAFFCPDSNCYDYKTEDRSVVLNYDGQYYLLVWVYLKENDKAKHKTPPLADLSSFEILTIYEGVANNDPEEGRGGIRHICYCRQETNAEESVAELGVFGKVGDIYKHDGLIDGKRNYYIVVRLHMHSSGGHFFT